MKGTLIHENIIVRNVLSINKTRLLVKFKQVKDEQMLLNRNCSVFVALIGLYVGCEISVYALL